MEEPVVLHFSDCDFVLSGENVRYLPGICEVLGCTDHHDFKAMPYERFRLALVVEKLCSPEGIYIPEWGNVSLVNPPQKTAGKMSRFHRGFLALFCDGFYNGSYVKGLFQEQVAVRK